jgi:hypothetical protein
MASSQKETLKTLQGMQTLMGSLTTTVGSLTTALAGMGKPIEEGNKSLKRWGDSLHDIIFSTEEGISNYKEILTLTTKLHRIDVSDAKEREKVVSYLGKLNKEYEKAKKFHEKDEVELKKIEKVQEAIGKAMKANIKNADDFTKAIEGVTESVEEAKGVIEDISFSKQVAEAKGVGKAFDDSIGGAIRAFKVLDNFGFKGLFGNLANMQAQVKRLKAETISSGKERMKQDLFDKKRSGENTAVKKGHADLLSFNADKRAAGFAKLQGVYSAKGMSEGDRSAVVRQLSGKTGVAGMLDRALMGRALKSTASGGGGMLGKMGMGLMSEGGGSMLGGAMGAIAGPAAALYGILQLFQQGFDRNKDIYSKLGKGGIVQGGGKMGANYNEWSRALEPGGYGMGGQGKGAARYYDLDFEKMSDMMKTVVESGQAVQTKYGKVNDGMTSDDAIGASRASNIYSGVVRNGAMFGKNIGLDTTESTQLTMKLLHEFSLSMGEVEDMFVHIGKAVQSTGISVVSYLKLLDDVTSEFDKLNKSLNFTCGLMLLLGKNATYTTDDISKMVKGLEGDKKTYEQSIFAYIQMGDKGRLGFAESKQAKYRATGAKLLADGTIKNTTAEEMEKATDEALRNKVTPGHPEETAAMEMFLKQRNQGKLAIKDHSPIGLATQEALTGETPESKIAKQLSLLKVAMHGNAKLSDFIQASDSARNRVQSLSKTGEFLEVGKNLNLHPEDLTTHLGQAGHQILAGITEAARMNPDTEEGKAARAQFSNINSKGWKDINKNLDTGKDITEMKPVQDTINNLFSQRLSDVISDADVKAAKKTAEENQSYITGPLDYIKKALKALVEHIVTLLEECVNFFNLTLFKTDKQTLQEQKDRADKYAAFGPSAEQGPIDKIRDAASNARTPEEKKNLTEVADTVEEAQTVAKSRFTGTQEGNALQGEIHNTLAQDIHALAIVPSNTTLEDLRLKMGYAKATQADSIKKDQKIFSGETTTSYDSNDTDAPPFRKDMLDTIRQGETRGLTDDQAYNKKNVVTKDRPASQAYGAYQMMPNVAEKLGNQYQVGGHSFDKNLFLGVGHSPAESIAYQRQLASAYLDEIEGQSNYTHGPHKTAYELASYAEGGTKMDAVLASARDKHQDWLTEAATDPTLAKHGNLSMVQSELNKVLPGNTYHITTTNNSVEIAANTNQGNPLPGHAGETAPAPAHARPYSPWTNQ